MFIEGNVTDIQGNPIPNAIIDTWETDENGFYDTQVRKVVITLYRFLYRKRHFFFATV